MFPYGEKSMTVSTRINYDEVRKNVPKRYVLVFEVEDEDYFVSYDKDTTLGLEGSLNYTNEPIRRMVIPFESAVTAFCGLLMNRRGVAIAKWDHVAQRTGHEWWIERLIDNAYDVKEWKASKTKMRKEMTNEELFKCDRNVLLAAWNEYRRIVGDFIDKNPKNGHGGFARVPLGNPFTWLWKTCDTALLPEFEPGKLVVDSDGHYGIVVERTPGQIYDHEYRLNCVLVDFRGTAGRIVMDADTLKPAGFPPELLEFAISGNKDGLKEKVHEKVEEAFNV